MTDPDTRTSLPGDTPSSQEPTSAAPDPRTVKAQGDDSAAAKDPGDWVTGDEPMTGPQASYLATLAQQAGEEPPQNLTKSEASRAIDALQEKAGTRSAAEPDHERTGR